MDVHVLKFLFGSMTLVILVFGSLVNIVESRLPIFIVQSFRFGKFALKGEISTLPHIEVPKRWFRHFYLFGTLFTSWCLISTVSVYMLNGTPPTLLVQLLNWVATPHRTYTVSSFATLLAVLLMTMQCVRRFYETWFVSVFSSSKMNLAHYIVGFLHYFGATCAILAEAPGFTSHVGVSHLVLRLQTIDVHLYHILAVASFTWAFREQFYAAVLLADLRKDSSGKVINSQIHMVPHGRLFDCISSPHMFCEITMYLSLMVLLWGNSIFPWVAAWVVSNQVQNSLLTHKWYQSEFKEKYPKDRKAVLPFIL